MEDPSTDMPACWPAMVQKSLPSEKSAPDTEMSASSGMTFLHSTVFPIFEFPTIYVRNPLMESAASSLSSYVISSQSDSRETYVKLGNEAGVKTSSSL